MAQPARGSRWSERPCAWRDAGAKSPAPLQSEANHIRKPRRQPPLGGFVAAGRLLLLVPGRRLILRLAGVKGLDGWRTEHKSSEDRVYPLSGLKRDKRAQAVRDRSNDSNNTCTAPALGRWRLRLCANAHELGPNRRPAHRPDSAGSRQDDVPRRDGAGRACHQCKRSSGHSIARPRKSFA